MSCKYHAFKCPTIDLVVLEYYRGHFRGRKVAKRANEHGMRICDLRLNKMGIIKNKKH